MTPRGLTLVETMISVTLSSVLLLAAIAVYGTAMRNSARNQAESSRVAKFQQALKLIETDVLQSRTVSTHASYPDPQTALVLSVPIWDANGLLTANNDTIVYYLSGTHLLRRVIPGTGSARVATNGRIILEKAVASPAIFSYWTSGAGGMSPVSATQAEIVKVTLTAGSSWSGLATASVSSYFRLRNRR